MLDKKDCFVETDYYFWYSFTSLKILVTCIQLRNIFLACIQYLDICPFKTLVPLII